MEKNYLNKSDSTKFGHFLSHPSETEQVVISGISGKFPESNNVKEFADNLFKERDLLTDDTRRWEHKHPEIPRKLGKLPLIEKFDNGFFGLPSLRSTSCDPLIRQGLEVAIEAIFDSGVNIADLEGTNTAVFFASCMFESSNYWMFKNTPNKEACFSALPSMMAHELSYVLKLKGPSFALDTGSSGSFYVLEHAYKAIRQGQCNAAIVLGGNLCLQPYYVLQFSRLGVLSKDGVVRSFDADGNGYVRSDVIAGVFLQKSQDAKRIYCSIVHTKTNCDGFKDTSITFPGVEMQTQLFKEVYEECEIDVSKVKYIEAHTTSTKAGDPEELKAIENVYLQDPKSHLLIGSVKPNIGHSEPASGFSCLIKIIIAMESGYIPPTINYKKPNPRSKALLDGRLEVVTKTTKIDHDGLIALNNMGFGGANAHLLVKPNPKVNLNSGKLKDEIPRIVCVSGRTKEAVTKLLNSIIEHKNEEHMRLLHDIFSKDIKGHNYRGFVVLNKYGEIKRSCKPFNTTKKPFSIIFGEIKDTQSLFRGLLQLPIFVDAIQKVKTLMKNVDIENVIIGNGPPKKMDRVLASIVIEIGIMEIIKSLKIEHERVSGAYELPIVNHILTSYCNGTISLADAVDCSYVSVMKAYNKSIEIKINKYMEIDKRNTDNGIEDKLHLFVTKESNKKLDNSFLGCTLYVGEFSKSSKEPCDLTVSASVCEFLVAIGSLYEVGYDFNLHQLFPLVAFPVSRGTPMISPDIKWNHKRDWLVPKYEVDDCDCQKFTISLEDQEWAFLEGDVIDGRILFPASGFLYLAWETLSLKLGIRKDKMRVVFENCKFKRACLLTKNGTPLKFTVVIQRFSGNFEIEENNTVVATGRIYIPKEGLFNLIPLPKFAPYSCNKISNEDIYKELRLRGYQYRGEFKGMQEYDFKNDVSNIAWNNNWIIFIENAMQMRALQNDDRKLYFPTSIRRVYIDSILHNETVKAINNIIPAYNYRNLNLIRSGGVCISGISLIETNRRKQNTLPVLEKYTFVPNVTELTLAQSIRVNMQLILENHQGVVVKAVEFINDQSDENIKPLSSLIDEISRDIPLINPELTIDNTFLCKESDYSLAIGTNLLQKEKELERVFSYLKPNGFILSREKSLDNLQNSKIISVLTIHTTETETLILLRKSQNKKNHSLIKISSEDTEFSWLPKMQNLLEKNSENIIAYSQNDPFSGILGLVQTVQTETFNPNLQTFFILDEVQRFDVSSSFYLEQINKNMTFNVLKDNVWGTYRHLPIDKTHMNVSGKSVTNVENTFLNHIQLESKVKEQAEEDIEVYYTSIPNQDSGSIVEFSGISKKGSRVMGLKIAASSSTGSTSDKNWLWNIPDHWSLEDAVTIPSSYSICLHTFLQKANVKAGESVLIHFGASPLGQAAISLALSLNCKVYTTVNTQEEHAYILKHFPKLAEKDVTYYDNAQFVTYILKYTKGKGVNVIFSPLPEQSLLASARCLAQFGQLMQLGKLNINNDELNLALLQKNASYHVLMEQFIFNENKIDLYNVLQNGISSNLVNPLARKVLNYKEMDRTVKCNLLEKLVIKIREERISETSCFSTIQTNYRYMCDSDKVYVLCGGLGGFGLELADWLVNRGCKKLVLNSRRGISSGYQSYRINVWKSNGCSVLISTNKIGTKSGVNALIDEAQNCGPVAAVFNLAADIQDALFKNQTPESLRTAFVPKAYATKFLDEVTREKCPELSEFVMFSSITASRGNPGQSNYGMANNVLEMICEKRKKDGYPAMAIQWAPIGDVGMVATLQESTSYQIEMCGGAQQSISSCLEVINTFLSYKYNIPIVSSIVIAEKKKALAGEKIDPVRAVANILGISDIKSYSFQSTLAEIGMDSMSALEIKQVLESEFDVYLSETDLKNLTIFKLREIEPNMTVKT